MKPPTLFSRVARIVANRGRAHETPEQRKAAKILTKKMSRHSRR